MDILNFLAKYWPVLMGFLGLIGYILKQNHTIGENKKDAATALHIESLENTNKLSKVDAKHNELKKDLDEYHRQTLNFHADVINREKGREQLITLGQNELRAEFTKQLLESERETNRKLEKIGEAVNVTINSLSELKTTLTNIDRMVTNVDAMFKDQANEIKDIWKHKNT